MSSVQSVIATFNLPGKKTLIVNLGGTGTGTVTSSPPGISCGPTCAFDFPDNTTVTLAANPNPPSTFGGWSGGGCAGTSPTCNVTLSTAQTVAATFNPPSNQTFTTAAKLNPISSTVTLGQTNVAFSGQIASNPAVPDGQTIQLQVRSGGCGPDGFAPILTTTTSSGNGSFSSSFTAPSLAGTYGLRASFPQAGITGGNAWQPSNSDCQTVTVNAAIQTQTIVVTTHVPPSAPSNTSFQVVAFATSNLPVSISGTGACTGVGSGSANIVMTSSTGICTVSFNQSGNANFSAAAPVLETVPVSAPFTQTSTSTNTPTATVTNTPSPTLTSTNPPPSLTPTLQ